MLLVLGKQSLSTLVAGPFRTLCQLRLLQSSVQIWLRHHVARQIQSPHSQWPALAWKPGGIAQKSRLKPVEMTYTSRPFRDPSYRNSKVLRTNEGLQGLLVWGQVDG